VRIQPFEKFEQFKNFKPKFSFYEIEYLVGDGFGRKIKNESVHAIVKKLTEKAYPSSATGSEKRWEYFYMPARRSGRKISIPFLIVEYKGDFYVYFRLLGNLEISGGKKDVEKEYQGLFEEAIRFTSLIKSTDGKIVKETVPYDLRIGKIKGKYVMDKTIPEKEERRLLKSYETHLGKNLEIVEISLNDYLDVTAICYKAAYKKTKKLLPLEMYKKWADNRHGGMLDIKDFNSKKEYRQWRKSGKWAGSHPYEIVFSWHRHGIHLYPPDDEKPHYSLRVTNYAYAGDFIRMTKALLNNEIAFRSNELEEVLNYLRGEKDFVVNDYDDLRFSYIPSREYKNLYFKHIKWEELKIVRCK